MVASIKKFICLSFFMILGLSHNTLSADSIKDGQEDYHVRGQLYTQEGDPIGEPFYINLKTGTSDNPNIDPGDLLQIIDQPQTLKDEFVFQTSIGQSLEVWKADEEESRLNRPN